MKWYDLSQTFSEEIPHAKVLRPPKINRVMEVGKDLATVTEFTLNTHIGTHVDAPSHILSGGANLDQFNIDKFIGEGIVLNIPKNEREPISVEDIKKWSEKILPGDIMLIRTGWGKEFLTERYHEHPYLSLDAANWLVDRGISIVGIDFLTVDIPHSLRDETFDFEIHKTLLDKDILIIEHLFLEDIPAGERLFIVAAPLKFEKIDGSPCRVVAKKRQY